MICHFNVTKLPKLICLEQSLWRYRSTSSATSSSVSGSPRTRFLSSINLSMSVSNWVGAAVPVHFLSRRPGPNGEKRFGSRYPIGSIAGFDSEYEYLKSKARSDFTGSFGWLFGSGVSFGSVVFLGLGFLVRENGGSYWS